MAYHPRVAPLKTPYLRRERRRTHRLLLVSSIVGNSFYDAPYRPPISDARRFVNEVPEGC